MSDGKDAPRPNDAPSVRAPRSKFVAAKIYTLATLLRRATNIAANRELGLSQQQARLLMLLAEHQPASLGDLAQYSAMDVGLLSRTVKGLVDLGHAVRKQRGRFAELRLTVSGEATAGKLLAAAEARNEHILSDLDPEERARLYAQLDGAILRATELLEAEWRQEQARMVAE